MSIRITPTVLQEAYTRGGGGEGGGPVGVKEDFRGIVIPGEVIFTSGANLITGHGTYRVDDSGGVAEAAAAEQSTLMDDSVAASALPMHASMAGRLKSVNKLVYVEPPNTRYSGNVGDTVVGRIVEVEQKRWKVDVNSYHLANLSLANVKLPTGELRRKSEDDERAMRSFMREGDLIVAEVREVYRDGSLQLHMPGMRTGRLGEGCVLRLPPSLIRRQKIHRHQLVVPCGGGGGGSGEEAARSICVGLILGCNGLVWIGPERGMNLGARLGATISARKPHSTTGAITAEVEERVAVGRVRNVVLALVACGHLVWETAVLAGCEASFFEEAEEAEGPVGGNGADGAAPITRLLLPEHQRHLVDLVMAKLAAA
ncbi:Exosome complex exonuclease RRP4 [Echinococcus granulosus]|uniref:Exosome complex exonuclease RRP4 n=1 Tax=Echinococcus granulosus TaxID=6210 RepID=U6JCD3_ECHGR|nr:Exosome complex exonuclease RRP4 [Echinococcus granulosus]EUB57883.1 Exosome complex exonuclease RRP4 [Echinococcus granulosus]CDS20986.1 Exosome complex exonuclease RRP4 [Echinococcus granulosus]